MSCNRDSNCLNIANDYVTKKSSINSSLNSMKTNIETVGTSLNNIESPSDYLGNKVKEKIEIISSNLSNSVDNITSFNNNINTFINNKEIEHRNHYNSWKKAQEAKEKEKSGEANA